MSTRCSQLSYTPFHELLETDSPSPSSRYLPKVAFQETYADSSYDRNKIQLHTLEHRERSFSHYYGLEYSIPCCLQLNSTFNMLLG